MGSFYKSIVLLVLAAFPLYSSQSSLRPAQPTHYFYVPTAYLNDEFDLVASMREISYALPAHLQVQMSLVDNIGRINFGARYGFKDNLSVGAGMAWTFVQITDDWHHGIKHVDDDGKSRPRLGAFLAWGIAQTRSFEACLVPHMQLGHAFSLGADFALKATPHEFWSVIWEVGTSFDLSAGDFWFNTDGGFRIHPPAIPYLTFDGGIDLVEANVEFHDFHVAPYFDVNFAIKTK
jgi:hypothetical protein